MPNTCTGVHFSCGNSADWNSRSTAQRDLTQTLSNKISFMLGNTEILVVKKNRLFKIKTKSDYTLDAGAFLMYNEQNELFACGDSTLENTNSVSENYSYTTTELYYLDSRYNNAIGKETVELLTFSKAGSDMAEFRMQFGNGAFPKFVITNHEVTRTYNYFIVINGVKTVLQTSTSVSFPNTEANPLILVYPNPPSLAMTFDPDITQHGFYDYHATGEGEGQTKIQRDGGDDFYFTDWMRTIGELNRDADQASAEERYISSYLGGGAPPVQTLARPGLFINSTPVGSIAVDSKNRVFYSLTVGGTTYNDLTTGDLTALLPTFSTNPKFYPITPGG